MTRPDFAQLKADTAKLQELDRISLSLMEDEERQSAAVREACSAMLLKSAEASLESVPVEELSRSKAGIRVSALSDAGFANLKQLDEAADWEIARVEGVGEKQVESIRNILTEFKTHLAEHASIRLSAEDKSADNLTMILALARYRQGAMVRRDYAALAESVHAFAANVLPRLLIRSRLKWIFSGKAAKESTVQACDEILNYFGSPSYERSLRLIAAYDEAINYDMPSAMRDFERNGADFYALMEKLGGTKLQKPLIYSSIPQQLAAEIDDSPLDESVFNGNLRAYQVFGAKYILHQKRVLLGDEMGLGKTVQAVAAMAHIDAEHSGRNRVDFFGGPTEAEAVPQPADPCHFLVICPASVLVNWCREIEKFSSLKAFLIHGPYLEDAFAQWQRDGGVAVANYESMGKIVRRIDNHMRLQMLIIDEAHYIKNPDAQRTKHIRRLDDESERILMMTGTPLENRVEEMCSLIDFIQPDMAGEMRRLSYMSRIPEFREIIAPVYLRRLRADVLEELPPITEIDEWCKMTEADAADYAEKIRERNFSAARRVSFLWNTSAAGPLKPAGSLEVPGSAAPSGNAQAVSGNYPGRDAPVMRGPDTSSKAQRLLEICREAGEEGRRIIVFSYFLETIEKVAGLLGSSCIGTITGSTDIGARQSLVDRLKDAPDGSILVAQIQAGGTGLNIQSASEVIFCEPQIKPSLTMQALSRVYRMGQIRNVVVHHLLCPDTVDEAVIGILKAKQHEFDNYADESAMAEATENLIDRDWIRQFLDEESRRYLPAVVTAPPV